ncbi:peptidoglycan-binding domain-containing protein [Hamadaea sp. NPDC051192]|uniref:peptidoglycan-binding domain-containing protein n=1 Tax=Hamadaea sp. NPDC051192 TaxID=3154940 RepID=UPI0034330EFF
MFCYGQGISIDGEYGPNTRQAVKNVQSYLNTYEGAGWAVDGWAGPGTRKKMKHVATEQTFCVHTSNPSIWPGWEWLDVPY